MLLSAIVPNFNHGQFISKAIDCLVNQSRPPDEIIVIDDGSSDDSATIVKQIAKEQPRVQPIILDENVGLIAVLNLGIEKARGRYIYFAAADDWVEPGFFDTAMSMLGAHPQSAFFCGECKVVAGETGQSLGVRPPIRPCNVPSYVPAESVAALMHGRGHVLVGSTIVYRRDRVREVGGLDASLGSFADGYLARKLAFMDGFCFAPQAVATWNVFNEGMSRQTAVQRERATALLELAQKRLRDDPAFPPAYADEFARLMRFSNARLALGSDPVNLTMLEDMAMRSPPERSILRTMFAVLPTGLARAATLAWLWAKLRPYSLWGMFRTKLARWAPA